MLALQSGQARKRFVQEMQNACPHGRTSAKTQSSSMQTQHSHRGRAASRIVTRKVQSDNNGGKKNKIKKPQRKAEMQLGVNPPSPAFLLSKLLLGFSRISLDPNLRLFEFFFRFWIFVAGRWPDQPTDINGRPPSRRQSAKILGVARDTITSADAEASAEAEGVALIDAPTPPSPTILKIRGLGCTSHQPHPTRASRTRQINSHVNPIYAPRATMVSMSARRWNAISSGVSALAVPPSGWG
jgi:hypothetical protein